MSLTTAFYRKTKETVDLEGGSEQTLTVAWSSWGLWKPHWISSYRKPTPGECGLHVQMDTYSVHFYHKDLLG